MNKILFIIGPTAMGKTALALKLAKKFKGDIISADSRQVYRGMDIGTGKDLPKNLKTQSFGSTLDKNSKFKGINKHINYYIDGRVRIFGLDLVEPNEEFSVAHFIRFAIPIIEHIWKENKLPIIVGGTGLYVRALRQYFPEIFATRDLKLRRQLDKLSVVELQNKLKQRGSEKFDRMNDSDRKNPRRLIRAIEQSVNQSADREFLQHYQVFIKGVDELTIGLTIDLPSLYNRIDKRVDKRLKQGVINEVKHLINQGYHWNLPSMSGLGYKEWRVYFSLQIKNQKSKIHQSDVEDTVKLWKQHEHQYAKRQMTWYKKESMVHWFNTEEKLANEQIVTTVGQWYNK